MQRLLLVTVALLALAAAPEALAATRTVDIVRTGFSPDRLTVDPGDTVTWTNKDTAQHQIVADQARFPASPVLQSGQSYSYTFTRSDSYGYRDTFAQNERGTIIVREGVSIAAAVRVVAYGAPTTLSGAVSNGRAGEAVTVDAQECGSSTFTKLGTVNSTANGGWTFGVKPTRSTVYRVRWKSASSTPVTVQSRPLVRLAKLAARRFRARVTAAQSFVGKYVVLQRYSRTRRSWVSVKRVVLRTATAGVAPTTTSAVSFRSRHARGTRLRLVFPQSQAGTCYAAANSNTVRA